MNIEIFLYRVIACMGNRFQVDCDIPHITVPRRKQKLAFTPIIAPTRVLTDLDDVTLSLDDAKSPRHRRVISRQLTKPHYAERLFTDRGFSRRG